MMRYEASAADETGTTFVSVTKNYKPYNKARLIIIRVTDIASQIS
ncbi:hypothetical protein [Pedobacter terrae]